MFARKIVRWYLSPSGMLFGLAVLGAAGALSVPSLRLVLGGVSLLAFSIFVPYRFIREQVRQDRAIEELRREMKRG